MNTGWRIGNKIKSASLIRIHSSIRNKAVKKKYARTYRPYSGEVPHIDNSYDSWSKLARFLLSPFISDGHGFHICQSLQVSIHGRKIDSIEAFCRSFIGASFLICGSHLNNLEEDPEFKNIVDYYTAGILAGVDPRSKEYWGTHHHLLIENTSLIIGLLLTKDALWDKYSTDNKELIVNYIKNYLNVRTYKNNWLWFKVMHLLFLEKIAGENHYDAVMKLLHAIESMHLGGGWYADGVPGDETHVDYYAAWAMQYYSLIFTMFASDDYIEQKETYVNRTGEFLKSYQHYLTPGNIHVPFGRSQLYRFAALSPIGLLLSIKNNVDVDMAWLKTCVTDNVNTFLKNGILDRNGFLTMGLFEPDSDILEPYSGAGSPYWAMKVFSFLMVPREHDFWKTKAVAKSVRKVYTVVSTKQILLHNGQSEIKLINVGSKNSSHPLKYNKFAYSNIFFADYSRKNNCPDNSILFKCGNAWRGFGKTVSSDCKDGLCSIEWVPEEMNDIRVLSILAGFPDGYVFIHKIRAKEYPDFMLGGFLIAEDAGLDTMKNDGSMVLYNKQSRLMSGLEIYARPQGCKFGVYESINTLSGKRSTCPIYKGTLMKKEQTGIISGWVWTSLHGSKLLSPEITFGNGGATIKYDEREYDISLI